MKRRQQIINANAAKSHGQWQRSLQWSVIVGPWSSSRPSPLLFPAPPWLSQPAIISCRGLSGFKGPVGSLVRLALSPHAPCPPPLLRGHVVWNEATVCRPPRIRQETGPWWLSSFPISCVLLCCSLSWSPYLPFLSFPTIFFSTCLHMPWMFWTGPRFLRHPKWVSRHSWLSSATLAAQTQPPAFADLIRGNWRGKQVFPQALLSNQWAPDSASFGSRQPGPCSSVYSRPRGISMGYLGGQWQVGTGHSLRHVGRAHWLVSYLWPFCQLPEPVYHVLTSPLGETTNLPRVCGSHLGGSGFFWPGVCPTPNSWLCLPIPGPLDFGFLSSLLGILRWALTWLTRWDAQFLHCLSRSYAPNIYTRFLAFAPGKPGWTTRVTGK